ncbi:hypothetical protein [Clostridium algidicarnis]|uniref:hypothetical protein n=1 Tax=Clostridium algidicarnis TaxID=37659 RepID=UPI001C0BE8D4|nr:hypothetical protein [Clostridium algidicarnis]MBU3205044.1 hypothetical protein [Clostridium algidicarnis]MBU3213197.1 hypothetical protein [Clostridium algidicarnis]MBU3223252.1 hypothetical protein [Clostridium algidicarnis]MBU3228049.1 hypothetical protein [Clostridium algidicarnis]MBU3251781.1 hypothetical protein [Clostridium algidicarnis]
MSLQKNIRTLFYTSKIIAIFIIYSMISNGLGQMTPGYLDFLIAFFIMIIMQILEYRNVNRYVVILLPLFMSFVGFFLLHGREHFVPYSVLGLITVLALPRYDAESISSYKYILRNLKNSLFMLIGSLVLYLKVDKSFGNSLLRYYIAFLVIAIITLREGRKFEYDIKRKKEDDMVNFGILIAVIVISSNFVYNICKTIIFSILKLIAFMAEKILVGFVYIITVPLNALVNYIQNLLKRNAGNPNVQISDKKDGLEELKDIVNDQQVSYVIVENIIKIIIIAAIIYLIYFVIKKYRYSKVIKEEGIVEVREKISVEKPPKKKTVKDKLKDIIGAKTLNEKILNIYKDFEKITFKKGWFKPYMTPRQLYKVTRIHIEEKKKIKYITKMYNEAKFSSHEISEDEFVKYKEYYGDIKDKIKDVQQEDKRK